MFSTSKVDCIERFCFCGVKFLRSYDQAKNSLSRNRKKCTLLLVENIAVHICASKLPTIILYVQLRMWNVAMFSLIVAISSNRCFESEFFAFYR